MITIKKLLNLAFVAGQNSGIHIIRNLRNDLKEPETTFEELISDEPFKLLDLETEVKIKANDN